VFLAERLTKIEYAGMAAVLVAVFLVNSSKMSGGETVADVEVTEFKPLA
jgi:drug/metabolite transporter (DMT)-like permease